MTLINSVRTITISMKKLYKYLPCSILLLVLFCGINTYAQEALIIRGKVTDQKDRTPIQNVSVAEVDADNRIVRGISTDIDGNFALKISNPKNRISVSYIGYKSLTQDINGRSSLNIALEQEGRQLDEVVVTAQSRTNNGNLSINDKNLTVAVAKINAKDLEEMGSASIDQALQGRLSGVDIAASSGDPGAGMSIRIRGTSSINAGANPLIVVDGMPYETQIPSDFNFGTADEQG